MTTTYLTAAEVAAELDLDPSQVRRLCRAGHVPGARLDPHPRGAVWMIPRSALARLRPGVRPRCGPQKKVEKS